MQCLFTSAPHAELAESMPYAGVSTAFAAPIGGLLLAIEEGASFLTLTLFWRGFLATCTGVLTLHFLAQWRESGSAVMDSKFGIRRDLGYVPWPVNGNDKEVHSEIHSLHG